MTGFVRRVRNSELAAPLLPRGRVDKCIVVTLALMLCVGLTTLFAASFYGSQAQGSPFDTVLKQLIGVAMGLAALTAFANFPY